MWSRTGSLNSATANAELTPRKGGFPAANQFTVHWRTGIIWLAEPVK